MIKEERCLTAEWYGLQISHAADELCIVNKEGYHIGLWQPHIDMNQLEWLKDKMLEEIKKGGDISIHITYTDRYNITISCGNYIASREYKSYPVIMGCGDALYECWLDTILSYIRSKK